MNELREPYLLLPERAESLHQPVDWSGFVERWNAYLADGAIYGETQDGMLRWLKEKGEVNRLQREAEQIEQRQANIRDFKEMLARKRAKQS